MTDRELLELAARAACMDLEWQTGGWAHDNDTGRLWNPLTDDGDALRLARACNLTIQFRPGRFHVGECPAFDVCMAGDMTEVRHAIVHAAAAIGKDMK